MRSGRKALIVLSAAALLACAGAYAPVIDREQKERDWPVLTVAFGDATSTMSTPPSTVPTPKAVPMITGPAPLPSEEQGLPGDN